jgi:hypothetical protein
MLHPNRLQTEQAGRSGIADSLLRLEWLAVQIEFHITRIERTKAKSAEVFCSHLPPNRSTPLAGNPTKMPTSVKARSMAKQPLRYDLVLT